MDRLTESAHFLAIKVPFTAEQLADLYIREVVRRHGIPFSIVSDRDIKFFSKFCYSFQSAIDTKLYLIIAFHPQSNGQLEKTIQTLEIMLRACALDYIGSWDHNLALVEFSYNNSYDTSIGMAPYEALYNRHYKKPMCGEKVGEREPSKVKLIDQTKEIVNPIRKIL